ncbi:hypothetical protein [Chitinophaga sancti]|uniref:Phosphate-selective porin O and P n=1 Tax=Chitinophaga sancti TaxID=1004 RepID=A0A1K1RJS0_9BACT|nr:hypothetical protein [Chitinophaga sancti]WQD60705.1 hypothetical protein U0033_22670 [Chitinophaga sancti]WQG87167.1 hypothetical protein SR876_19800 [Chitinophaga sancti]SFW72051.1 hypothetical protein SAMN05661012_03864 [Chitinophaga sancti]
MTLKNALILTIGSIVISFQPIFSQQITPAQRLVLNTGEDSLNAGTSSSRTVISGYGSAFYQRDMNEKMARATLERVVLFVGHQFNSKIAFFSEMELENAKVQANAIDNGFAGELSMEQAYLKFSLNPRQYIVAGLFVPRIGILNENHLPVNFNGVQRPIVEQLVIPATWRELGIGFYGRARRIPLNYTVALVNGLNDATFTHGTGVVEGRAEGSGAYANNLAITASLQYYWQNFRFQVSGYAGGTNGLNARKSDSLKLSHGTFSLPLYLGEADIMYSNKGFSAKAIATMISFPNAYDVNRAYANNVAKVMYGAYGELAYNLLENAVKYKDQQLNIFGRYEMLDLNSSIPSNGIYDGTLKQQHIIAGFTYLPIPNVAIKADVKILHTGDENPALVINPSPARVPYRVNNSFLNIGIGYSF